MKHKTRTKALSWLLSLALIVGLLPGMSLTALAAGTSVWTGEEPISWNTDVAPGSQYEIGDIFSGLQAGETISVSAKLTDGYYNDPQYVLTYKAGVSWDWKDLNTNINVSDDGTIITYTVESDQIATDIAERGLIFRGQGYTITNITVTTAHTHDFTYSADGATITATCSADGCDLPEVDGNHTATLTINVPTNLIAGGSAEATVTGEIPDVTTPDIMYEGRNGTTYEKSATAPTKAGAYTASVTLENVKTGENQTGKVSASVDFTIKDASYTITIPATLTVENAGWNATAGVTAKGEIAEGTRLTVTATSANGWKLKKDETNTVDYHLATEEGGEQVTAWSFTMDELLANAGNGTNKPMGAVVADYVNAPEGDYTDTVTFTAEVKSEGPKIYSSLTSGDVLHVGDVLDSTTTYNVDNRFITFDSIHTIIRADVEDGGEEWSVTEKENGAYYVIKSINRNNNNNITYFFNEEDFPVTATSDGILFTYNGKHWVATVHEP